jgi:hypothetical protein
MTKDKKPRITTFIANTDRRVNKARIDKDSASIQFFDSDGKDISVEVKQDLIYEKMRGRKNP